MTESSHFTFNIYNNHSVQVLPEAALAVQNNDNRQYHYGGEQQVAETDTPSVVANIPTEVKESILMYFKNDRSLLNKYLPCFAQCMCSSDIAKVVADLVEDDQVPGVHKDIVKKADFIEKLQPLCPLIVKTTSVGNIRQRIDNEMEARRKQRKLNAKISR